jgi:hypothetical protein
MQKDPAIREMIEEKENEFGTPLGDEGSYGTY